MKATLFFYMIQKIMNCSTIIKYEEFNKYLNINLNLVNSQQENEEESSWYIYHFLRNLYYRLEISNHTQLLLVKYLSLHDVLSNLFYADLIKDECIRIIGKTNKSIMSFSRLIHIYKLKASAKIDMDLNMKPINIHCKNSIILRENCSNFMFTLTDLLNIINTSLSNCSHFFICSKFPKNPYTNIPFSISNMYNIYYKLKQSDLPFSCLFHQFYKSHFDIETFKIHNEILIREEAFNQFIKFGLALDQEKKIRFMLKSNQFTKSWSIDKDFPQEQLIDIFKPLLKLYLDVEYGSKDCEKYYLHKKKLSVYLTKMYDFNKLFGRKIISVKNRSVSHNSKHLTFKELEKTYMNLVKDNNLISYQNDININIIDIFQLFNNNMDFWELSLIDTHQPGNENSDNNSTNESFPNESLPNESFPNEQTLLQDLMQTLVQHGQVLEQHVVEQNVLEQNVLEQNVEEQYSDSDSDSDSESESDSDSDSDIINNNA